MKSITHNETKNKNKELRHINLMKNGKHKITLDNSVICKTPKTKEKTEDLRSTNLMKNGKHKISLDKSFVCKSPDSPSKKLSKLVHNKKNIQNSSLISLKSKSHHASIAAFKVDKKASNISKPDLSKIPLIKLTSTFIKSEIKTRNITEEMKINPESFKVYPKIESKDTKCSVKNADNSIVMSDILRNSFLTREKLTDDDKESLSTEDVPSKPSNEAEWCISSNNTFSHVLNPPSFGAKEIMQSNITSNKIVKTMVDRPKSIDTSWENPVIGVGSKKGIPSLLSKDNKPLKKMDKIYSSCSFTKDMLKKVNIIGPVDNKFIACVICTDKNEKMLVLVDQHAAHERIRLEKLLTQVGYYSNEKKKISGNNTALSPPASLYLSENDTSLMIHYKKEFDNVGLRFAFVKTTNSSSKNVFISSVPAIFVSGSELKLEAKGTVLNTDFLKEFIVEQIKYMKSTGCPCNTSSRTIFKALASYACHGAIRFGDKISLLTCRSIMKDLAKCDLPFQCAHGRPSIAPIFQINFLDHILKKKLSKPNLTKIMK